MPAARATAGLLGAAEPPTAILYDGDVLAAAGLGAAQRLGVSVPGAVSLISWDDSALCELVYPALTALRWDLAAAGLRRRPRAARAVRRRPPGERPPAAAPAPRTGELGPGRRRQRPVRPTFPADGVTASSGAR